MSALSRFIANLGELQGVASRVAREASDGINDAIQEEFEQGHDPYGKPWAPLLPQTVKRMHGDTRILRRTDRLMSETVARPMSGAGIEITSVDYGMRHQFGTKHMVPRPVLSDGAELPESWQDAIDTASENAIKRAMKR